MIRVAPPPEPDGFDIEVRQKGLAWLNDATYGANRRYRDRPHSYWTEWKECARALAAGFGHRCGYTASHTPVHRGNVDHFVSWAECQAHEHHHLAYEWSNFRWLDGRINTTIKSKIDRRRQSKQLIDPFAVEDAWFALDLLSKTLSLTEDVPSERRELIQQTLDLLDLVEGSIVMEQRERALRRFRAGLTLELIEEEDPLVARALRKLIETPDDELAPVYRDLKHDLLNANREARTRDPMLG
ncbi:MAG: hypothetical protein HC927_08605 [Deltaproteobacteria bacterium]|nr:hypothetical protein [Deltaproteobacteria bacterium]